MMWGIRENFLPLMLALEECVGTGWRGLNTRFVFGRITRTWLTLNMPNASIHSARSEGAVNGATGASTLVEGLRGALFSPQPPLGGGSWECGHASPFAGPTWDKADPVVPTETLFGGQELEKRSGPSWVLSGFVARNKVPRTKHCRAPSTSFPVPGRTWSHVSLDLCHGFCQHPRGQPRQSWSWLTGFSKA
ncbi:hypothetical protein NFI96_024988 [Prochilodus magdalenae]|nr:hypothetical protein NFI96_024988 [Prochilodus magdalenae]